MPNYRMKQFYFLFLFFTSVCFAQLTPPVELQSYYNGVDFSNNDLDLFDDLAVQTASKHINYITYTPGVWEADKITDEDPSNSSNVLLIYGYDDNDGNYVTDRSRSKLLNGGTQGTDWNREHTFPNSLGNPKLDASGTNVPPYADAHNLRPSDVKMNADRVANRDLTEKIIQEKFLEFETKLFFIFNLIGLTLKLPIQPDLIFPY